MPAGVAAWAFGFQPWPGGLAAVLVGVVAAAGLAGQRRIASAAGWIGAQTAVAAALVALTAWAAPASSRVPVEAAALAVVAAGLIVTIEWGGALVGRAIKPFTDKLYEEPAAADGLIGQRGLPQGFADGGKAIGRWERLLIFCFVLAGSTAAIGFLVTAKSILRFGEIKDGKSQKEAEYIIIGTLMSFGFALVAAYLTRLALTALLPPGLLDALTLGGGE